MAIHVNFLGRLIADPIEKNINGNTCAIFTQVTDSLVRDKDNKRKPIFISVTAWNNNATNILKYCQKGIQILTTGKVYDLSAYSRKDNGEPAPSLSVTLDDFEFPNNKKER